MRWSTTRRGLRTWCWLLAAWPIAFFLFIAIYSIIWPPGNFPGLLGLAMEWSFRVVLVASLATVLVVPILVATGKVDRAPRIWPAFVTLCVSAAFQAFCEFVLFQPIA